MNLESYRETLGGKIHRATVTDANVDYVGSITIDADLLDRADIWVGQKVQVVSVTTGERLETYTLAGERGSGVIAINGAAALRIRKGEIVIIIGYELRSSPKQGIATVLVDSANRIDRVLP